MSRAATDQNLLFGILAVQMDFVGADALIAAMNRWVLDKGKPLGVHLMDAGALSADTHALIAALVDKHIEQHGGRVEQSLAALSSVEPIKRELAAIADVDVQSSLAHAGAPTPRGDRHATLVTPQPRDIPAGERFHILRPHASGGLGKVSVARDEELNREVALKELHDRHADNPDSRARFLQEAEITGGLEHPGVVPIYGLGQYADGRPFYAMRFIRGDSLARAIERFHEAADPKWSRPEDAMQLRRLLGRLIDVCNAVGYAHSRGVLHRDLKPGNVMLGPYGETLVVDWGLAKPLGQPGVEPPKSAPDLPTDMTLEAAIAPQSGSGSAPTMMGSAVGTPAFMSPEQAAGRLDRLGPASDVYSLGATLYMLLVGKPPQDDDDLGTVLQRVQRGEFRRPRDVKPVVPKGLEAICLKAMATKPEGRYATPRRMAEDIEAWLADEPVAAHRESFTARSRRWVKKHRTLVTTAAAVLVVATAASSLGVLFLTSANQREREAKDAAIAAKTEAERAQERAEQLAGRNDALLALARKSLERYETLTQAPELNRYGMESLRGNLQEAGLEYYETLASQAGESEQDRFDRARAQRRLAATYWQLGQMEKALASYRQSLAMCEALEKEFPKNEKHSRGAAICLLNIGEMLSDSAKPVDAEAPLAQARERFEKLRSGKASIHDDTTFLAYDWSVEGERRRKLGALEDAAEAIKKSIEILRAFDVAKLSKDDSRDVRYRLGRALNQSATLESQALWRIESAGRSFSEAEQIMQQLFDEDRTTTDAGFSLVQGLRNSGFMAARQNLIDDARAKYAQAIKTLKQVERAAPDVPNYRQEMAELLHSMGSLQHPMDPRPPTAEGVKQLEEAVAIQAKLVEQYPEQFDRRQALTRYKSTLAGTYFKVDRKDDAKRLFAEALDELSKTVDSTGASVDTLYSLGELQSTVADQLAEAGENDEALTILEAARGRFEELARLAPEFGEAKLSLANVAIDRADLLEKEGRLVEAVSELDQMVVMAGEVQRRSEIEMLKSGMSSLVGIAKTLRWGYLLQVRGGELNKLADRGEFDALGRQCTLLVELTGEASDHYVAAVTLAYAAKAAATSDKLDEAARHATSGSLAASAVKELSAAWEKGYVRRSTGLTGYFSAAPTLKTLREAEDLAVLRDREDFQTLLKRIESDELPAK